MSQASAQADLAAVWHLADAVARWRALYAPPLSAALPPPVQAAVLLDAGFACSLQQARRSAAGGPARPEFALAAGDVCAFCAGALGGAVGAVLAVVSASDVRVTANGDGACLLHVPQAGAGGPGAPRMEVLSVHRPLLADEQALHEPGGSDAAARNPEADAADELGPPDLCAEGTGAPVAPANAALAAATVRGGTLAAEAGDLSMSWLSRLAALVSVGYAAEAAADAPAPAPLDVTLHLQVGGVC